MKIFRSAWYEAAEDLCKWVAIYSFARFGLMVVRAMYADIRVFTSGEWPSPLVDFTGAVRVVGVIGGGGLLLIWMSIARAFSFKRGKR